MMMYYLQFVIIVLLIIIERFTAKWAKDKIATDAPYRYGFLKEFEFTGDKAIFMYKFCIVTVRMLIVLLALSFIVLDM